MSGQSQGASVTTATLIGLASLASAMGVGRFALTPILPLMLQDAGVTLTDGSWLASANYLGYLIGAVYCMIAVPQPMVAIRLGLIGCAIFTLAMGLTSTFWAWAAWRLLAGVASAFVLVGVSAWAIPILARHDRERWAGRVFSGVGVGIAFAGMVGMIAGLNHRSSQASWIALGLSAIVVPAVMWRWLTTERAEPTARRSPASGSTWTGLSRPALIAAGCYTAFGYGYIIPATFLPAIARTHINSAAAFGWIWPAFGIAAALSTLVVGWIAHRTSPRLAWLWAQLLLTAGVLAPIIAINMATLSIAAACVGGSFMIITMSGIKEILHIGEAEPSRLVGMMTTGFAIGQIGGPMTVALLPGSSDALVSSSLIAVVALVISSCVLALGLRPQRQRATPRSPRLVLALSQCEADDRSGKH